MIDKATNEIVFNYYLKEYKNRSQAIEEYKKLNTVLAMSPNKKLLKINNTVFLLSLDNNEIEFHSIGYETSPFKFIRNLKKLFEFARSKGVSAISSYSNEEIFDKIVMKMNLGITKDIKVGPDGITYSYYRLEF
jgi:hypothetical protein